MRLVRTLSTFVIGSALAASSVMAQTPAADPSARLREVLPADVAERVLATISAARARGLPAAALENRALKFAARGVVPRDIERSVGQQAVRMDSARVALQRGGDPNIEGDEIEAGADVMRRGVSGSDVSALAQSAPSGRSLAVPLFVIGSLMDRGLPSDSALHRVAERLQARATDQDIERMGRELPAEAARGQEHRPAATGRELARTRRPGSAGGAAGGMGGAPASVPARGRPGGTPSGGGHRP